MAFIAMAGRAQTITTVEGLVYCIDTETGTAKVIDYDRETEPVSITIPKTVVYEGGIYTVTSIEQMEIISGRGSKSYTAFSNCTSLQSVNLPETLVKIGDYAFGRCPLTSIDLPEGLKEFSGFNETLLANIVLPEGLQRIGTGAFERCTSLKNIDIPAGVTEIGSTAFSGSALESIVLPEGLTVINSGMFSGCSFLSDVKIPESVTVIHRSAFRNCTSLVSIDLPKGLESIYDCVFIDCTALRNIVLPESLSVLDYGVFSRCTSLESVVLPAGITSIGWQTFYRCASLKDVDIPDNVTTIEGLAFSGCTSLVSIELPAGLKEISDGGAYAGAFTDCTSLAKVTFPEGLENIGMYAFEGCSSLADVVVPASLQLVDAAAFSGCPLADVACLATVPPTISGDAFDNGTYDTARLHVLADATGDYQAAAGWKSFLHIVGDAEEMVSISSPDASEASIAAYADGSITTDTPATINVYAQSGARVMHAADATMLSLESLPRGIYIINVVAGTERQVMKIAR